MTKKIDLLEAAESLPSQKAKKREESADKARIKQLETLLEKQTEQIEQTRDSSFKLNIGKKRGASNKRGDFVRVVIPDSHGSQIDPLAARAFLNDLEEIQPTEIILLGDQIECGGFLAQHHTLGYVAETAYTYADDIGAANQFLDEIQSRCPKARIDALEGNHERRIERWIVDQTLGRQRDAEYLRSKFSPELELNMKRRGIDYFNQGVYYDGLPIPATIRRGKCHFSHGEY